ncbi:hypothetical protein, conserved [Eimeria necatrix]|uniref:Protein DA1-like domain-containing protein n=1 Tax=Eimeria necatrix TaxID=51315 RepID=U6MNU5_9EIME|nr:hypothetical protein, conserved [Eimeria necatrix]CDJ63340.1 hypothetical protein, conserved [Eimeria necatrix]
MSHEQQRLQRPRAGPGPRSSRSNTGSNKCTNNSKSSNRRAPAGLAALSRANGDGAVSGALGSTPSLKLPHAPRRIAATATPKATARATAAAGTAKERPSSSKAAGVGGSTMGASKKERVGCYSRLSAGGVGSHPSSKPLSQLHRASAEGIAVGASRAATKAAARVATGTFTGKPSSAKPAGAREKFAGALEKESVGCHSCLPSGGPKGRVLLEAQRQQRQKVPLDSLACKEDCCGICGAPVCRGQSFAAVSLPLSPRSNERYRQLQLRQHRLLSQTPASTRTESTTATTKARTRTAPGAIAEDHAAIVRCHISCMRCNACGLPIAAASGRLLYDHTAARMAIAAGAPWNKAIASGIYHAACKERRCTVCGDVVQPSEQYVTLTKPEAKTITSMNRQTTPQTTLKGQEAGAAKGNEQDRIQHARCTSCSTCGQTLEGGVFVIDGSGGVQHSSCFCCCCCLKPLVGRFESHAFFSSTQLLRQQPLVTALQVDAAAAAAAEPHVGSTAAHGGCCCLDCSKRYPKCLCCDRRAAVYVHPDGERKTLPRVLNPAGEAVMRKFRLPYTSCRRPATATTAAADTTAAAAVLCGRCACLPAADTDETAAAAVRRALLALEEDGIRFSSSMRRLQQQLLDFDKMRNEEQHERRAEKNIGAKRPDPSAISATPAAVARQPRVTYLSDLPLPVILEDFGLLTGARARFSPVVGRGASPGGNGSSHLFGSCEVLQLKVRPAPLSLVLLAAEVTGAASLPSLHQQQQLQLLQRRQHSLQVKPRQQQQERVWGPLREARRLSKMLSSINFGSTRRLDSKEQRQQQEQVHHFLQLRFAKCIRLVRGLPALLLQQHGAHELLHAFIAINQFIPGSKQIEEGWCNVAAARALAAALKSLNSGSSRSRNNSSNNSANSSKATTRLCTSSSTMQQEQQLGEELLRYQLWKLAVSPDEIYGVGYRHCLRQMLGEGSLGRSLSGLPRCTSILT